jgi:hypothetical protein
VDPFAFSSDDDDEITLVELARKRRHLVSQSKPSEERGGSLAGRASSISTATMPSPVSSHGDSSQQLKESVTTQGLRPLETLEDWTSITPLRLPFLISS